MFRPDQVQGIFALYDVTQLGAVKAVLHHPIVGVSVVECQNRRMTLTGPTGMPAPPCRMSRSSSSSMSSILLASSYSSSPVAPVSSDSFPETCVCVLWSCRRTSPVDPGGCTAPEVTPSVSDSGNSCLVGGIIMSLSAGGDSATTGTGLEGASANDDEVSAGEDAGEVSM